MKPGGYAPLVEPPSNRLTPHLRTLPFTKIQYTLGFDIALYQENVCVIYNYDVGKGLDYRPLLCSTGIPQCLYTETENK